jgi:hypothetical protein
VAAVTTSAAELTPDADPDHPVLRRGKPVQEQGGRDLPDFKKEEAISRHVAISDAGPSEEQPMIYVCPEAERTRIEAAARELARSELLQLAPHRGIELPDSAKAGSAKAGSTRPGAAKHGKQTAAEIALGDEQFIPFDLDYNNYPTVVFSARYTPTGDSAQSAGGKRRSWVVTVVARGESDGKLVKLYSSVSDPRELDLYPEVRLVDALDPDGYGRAALLFREQKRDGVSWLLGRPTGYELQTIFETPTR